MKNKKNKKKNITLLFVSLFMLVLSIAGLIVSSGCGRESRTGVHGAKGNASPNIVFIIIDALRKDKLSCYGFPETISPELDAMAEQGVLFEQVISQSSWTRPSIGSMVTALYPRSIGIFKEKFDILHDKYLTLAEILKQNGYTTIGLTANPNINKVFNFHQGFDYYEGSDVIWKWMKLKEGKRKYDGSVPLPQSREIFQTVLELASEHGKDSAPVYVQIDIMEVHSPFIIRDSYKETFKDYPIKQTRFDYPREKLSRNVRWTLGAVKQVSYDIGHFVKKLRALPGWENTLFVFSSDHGQGLDDHPDVEDSFSHGNFLYESQLNVPLIFYYPGMESGSPATLKPARIAKRVRNLDIMPTILELAGLPVPGELDGVSLVSLFKGSLDAASVQSAEPDYFFAETSWRKINKIAVYSGKWKYIENRDDTPGVNPREMQPMGIMENGKITDKIGEMAELAKAFKKILYKWERSHKKAKRYYPRGMVSREEREQLKSLGYLQ